MARRWRLRVQPVCGAPERVQHNHGLAGRRDCTWQLSVYW